MENVIAIGLALILVFIIIFINNIFRNKSMKKLLYSQSFIHSIIKDSIPKTVSDKTKTISQSLKHAEKHMIKIVVIDNTAYWVKDNIFYTAQTENGIVIHETSRPVDIQNMPPKELDKMLFILDNLSKGENNDSSSSGN